MGVVSRLKKKGIIKDDELEKDKKKREESLKKSQEELPKASEFRNSLKTSKKTEREEDSDNWFQERNKGKKLKRVQSDNSLPKADRKELAKTIFDIGLATVKNDEKLNNILNTAQNLGSSAYTGIMQFGKTLNERMTDRQNLRINLANSNIDRWQKYGNEKDKEKAKAIAEGQAKLLGLKQNKDTGKIDEIKYEDANKEIQKKIDEENKKMSKRVEDSTGFGKITSEFASSLGNNLVGGAVSLINPMLGATYFVGSATGSYEDDARERGMEGNGAKLYAGIMGGVEGTLDYVFNFGALQSGFKAIGKESAEKIISKFGTSMLGNGIENAIQEGITEPINELIAGMTGGKDKANWENIGQRMYKSALYGFASGLIFDGIGRGLGSISNIQNKINNGEELSPTDLQNVVQELEASGMSREEIFEASKNNALEAVNAEAQRIKEEQQAEENQIQDTEPLPVANKQNTNSNRLRELAIEEINNSNASQKEKNDALDILNQMEEVTSQDVEDIRNFMSNVAELETEASKLKTDGNYKYDEIRRKKYMEYKNNSTPYNSKVVDEVLDTIPQNRNGRRTVKQWLQAADEIGNRISDLSNEEIEEIAYKSWFELQPTKNITQYDRETKSTVGFQKLTSDEWINTMNKAVNEARANNQVQNENSNKSSFSYDEINSKISNNSDKNKLTDKGITMTYVHMNNQNTGNYGTMYGQNIEPSGEYMNVDIMEGKNKIPGADYGIIHFDNPLILDHINTGETGWKKTLSEMFNNKTGKELSDAVKKAGYDGIITIDENGYYNEIVNLDGRKNNNTLENRVSGDALLNAQDLIDELKEVGAKVDDNGYVTVYHQTTKENADNIIKTGRMSAKEDGIFFSTSKNATQADGRGDTKIEFKIPVEDLVLDDIFDDNADVRIPLKNSKETIDVSKYLTNEVTNNQENNKQKQLDIIQKNNPMTDDYHTGIRSIEDIKTFDEVINDDESFVYGDFTKEDAEKALKEGKVTVYSSNPIEQGSFVSTSQNMAKDYAGDGKIYSQEVDLKDVAWINGDEGQYAKVKNNQNESIENIQQISSIDIQERLNNEINTAITNKVSKGRVSLGKVTDKIVKKVQSLLGIDVTNRTHVLSDNDIRHIINEHGDPKVELKKGQIPVTGNDIQKIPDIINNYDDIIKGNPNKKGDTIRYIKQYEDGTTYLVEVVPETSKTLNIKTMWKKPTSLANQQEPSLTSKTQSRSISSTSNNSITQSTKNVKNDSTVNNNSMQNTENNTQNNILKSEDIITKNKEENLSQKETEEKVAEILEKPQKRVEEKDRTWAIFKAGILDKGIVFEELSHKTKNRELQGKWDYTLTATARGQNAIGNARYEYDSKNKTRKQISKSLEDIRAEVGKNTKDFNRYMYHQLNIDRMTLEEKYGTANKPVFSNETTAEISKKIVDELEEKYPKFKEYAQDIYDYNNANKQELVKNGVISQELADKLEEMYPHYVPIKRVDTKGNAIKVPLDTNRTGVNAPLARATGGTSDIQPLFETMADRTMQTYRASARNNFGLELMNTLNSQTESVTTDIDTIIDEIGSEDTELLKEGKNGENPTFTVFNNGEKTTFEITKDMYDALKPLSDSSLLKRTWLKGVPNKISNLRRGVLTEYNPLFSITNAIKDAQDVIVNSQHTAKTFSKFPEAYSQILQKGYWYNEYIEHGGEQNSYFRDGEFESDKKISTAKRALQIPLDAISSVNNVIEMAPRLAEYIASRESGRSIETSMLDAARVTTNFKAGGDITKALNRNGATFLNASVQGFQQQIRNIKEANMQGLKGYALLVGRYAVAGVVPAIINSLVWKDDKDYDDLQDYVKDNYYCVAKLGDGKFVRLPKGRVAATLQKIVSNISEYMTEDKKLNLDSFAKDFWEDIQFTMDNVAPNNPLDNNVISPIIQAMKNTTWYGEDLVPQRLQDKPKEEQYDETTDSLSKWIGENLKVSPYKVNYLLDQYLGGVGDIILPKLTKQAENNVLEDKFTTDSVMKSRYPGEFFVKSDELKINSNSSKATDEDTLKYKYISGISSDMSNLYKQKREIQNSNATDKVKKRQLKEVQKQINSMAKEALENVDKVTINKNSATIGTHQYYKDTKGRWKKVTDEDKIEGVSLNTYTDYKTKLEETKQKKIDSGELKEKQQLSDSEKIKILLSSNYSQKEKAAIYEKSILSSQDETYPALKKLFTNKGLNINNYLEYKSQKFEANKKDDGTVKGKSVSGTKKKKVYNYVNKMDISYTQKLVLLGTQYKLSNTERNTLANYINNSDLSYDEKMTLYGKFKGFKVYKNGTITY